VQPNWHKPLKPLKVALILLGLLGVGAGLSTA
jgi:hypothetical protein